MNENREVFEIDLKSIFRVLWKRVWVILLAGILVATICASYAWIFISPTYSASVKMYVNNNYVGSPGFSSSQIVAAQSLADTYIVFMRSHNVLDQVIAETNLGYTYGQVLGMLSASTVNETEVFEIRVTCGNYKHAAIIANKIAEILPDKIAAVVDGSSVKLVDSAFENPNPVGPNYRKHLMLGFFIGVILSALVIVILNVLDTSITSEEYLQQAYPNIPLLAVVPHSENDRNNHNKGYYESAAKRSNVKKGGKA